MRYTNKNNLYFINELMSYPARIKNVLGKEKKVVINTKKEGNIVKFPHKNSIISFRNYLSIMIGKNEILTFCFKFNNTNYQKSYVVIGKTIGMTDLKFPHGKDQVTHVTCFSGKIKMESFFKFFEDTMKFLNYGELNNEQFDQRLLTYYNNNVFSIEDNNNLVEELLNTKQVLIEKVSSGNFNFIGNLFDLLTANTNKSKYSLEDFEREIEKAVNLHPMKKEEDDLLNLINEKEKELQSLKNIYDEIYKTIRNDAKKPYEEQIKAISSNLKDNYESKQKLYHLINSIRILIKNKNFDFRSASWKRMISEIENTVGLENFNLALKALEK